MVRSKDPALRLALLESAVAYAMRHGVAGLTLRPLAAEIGASARMLMHHFGSKEALVGEVLARIEMDLGATLLAEAGPEDTLKTIMLRFWDRLLAPELQPLLRSMFEVWGQAMVRPEDYQPFLETVVAPWTAFITARLTLDGVPPARAEQIALASTAAFHGLQLIRLTTNERPTLLQAKRSGEAGATRSLTAEPLEDPSSNSHQGDARRQGPLRQPE